MHAAAKKVDIADLSGQAEAQKLAPAVGKLPVFLDPSFENDMERARRLALDGEFLALAPGPLAPAGRRASTNIPPGRSGVCH